MKPGRIIGQITAGLLLAAGLACAARLDPVQWTFNSDLEKAPPGSTVPLRLTAKIDPGWHIYSLTIAKTFDGPIPTTASLEPNPAVASVQFYEPKPIRKLDPTIQLDTEMFENEAALWVPVTLATDASGAVELTAKVRYAVCDDKQCLPPKTKTASYTVNVDQAASVPAAFVIPAGYLEAKPGTAASAGQISASAPAGGAQGDTGLAAFMLAAFGFGLAAIFTPCVFPMIPITVSFFLNQRGGFLQALVFSLGIIVLFCALGLGVTAAIGPFGVVQLGSNPWVNGFISIVFGAFALSLLGAFELTLPSGLLTKLDQASRRGGYVGTLLMGLTFSLTSFACVGPFVGPLLVSSVQAKGAQPVLGMLSFATGLASPFFFLAAFPSVLKKLPRSGGWLMRVKVVMGFVLLAAMLKYLSNVDQVLQLNALTRERFLAAWFVLFALAGLYLLGLLRLEGIEASDKLGIGRLLTAGVFLSFACSLLPGMFGAPLGELDAYVPAADSRTGVTAASGGAAGAGGQVWMKNQLREALDIAKRDNKLVLVTFTGYACTNCHWMKANMFPRPEIADVVKDLVLVELYTDGTDAASEENQKLEDQKFSTVSMPFYALLDADERVVATFPNATRNASEFLAFLKSRPS
ncbi:MAG TPA: cytochrome c biogenesis protein CcdA [Bryobacteraceae bacterium]|nr:cytochrome c biogenesis protein CcdA [Bryobacteraceae bacterium]